MMYAKLALEGIRKNRQLYYPYILTCVGMVFIYFIISALSHSSMIYYELTGGKNTVTLLQIGRYIIAVFAVIFLFYSNSFLTRRRKKEFGLYNILGMSKSNIARILVWESLITAAVSLAAGIILGGILYKLTELVLVRLMDGEATYSISIAPQAIPETILLFLAIFALLFVSMLLRVRLSDPIDLLKSENVGEKPPKSNWLLGILGIAILGAGYYIAVSIEDPFDALSWFFAAAALVIIGTYLVFIAGSVLLCRILQKNKSYYYKKNHFISVSSMVYRMKRNGAGLASICVLATMVLIMMSSVSCLLAGEEEILYQRYPSEISFSYRVYTAKDLYTGVTDSQKDEIKAIFADKASDYGVEIQNVVSADYLYASCYDVDGTLCFSSTETSNKGIDTSDMNYTMFYAVGLDTYNEITGNAAELNEGEILLYASTDVYSYDELTIGSMGSYTVKEKIDSFIPETEDLSIYGTICVVVPDFEECAPLFTYTEGTEKEDGTNYEGWSISPSLIWEYRFDTGVDSDTQIELYDAVDGDLYAAVKSFNSEGGYSLYNLYSRAEVRGEYYGLYGGLFFLGAVVSAVFLLATVLIIYYKQITEGYEDASRFEIMQKVGMRREDIRKSINSQILTVFFLPLILSALHVVFAFPMIKKILFMFSLDNVALFLTTTLVCFVIFALFYTIVYKITSNAYFKLVSERRQA
ncbi:MAG: FtsX-like permease family protein [Clostridiales bacterium]|nr:FtsX-like permease family protein [Clostridiales bacterium]